VALPSARRLIDPDDGGIAVPREGVEAQGGARSVQHLVGTVLGEERKHRGTACHVIIIIVIIVTIVVFSVIIIVVIVHIVMIMIKIPTLSASTG
jgi:hypothetical protein